MAWSLSVQRTPCSKQDRANAGCARSSESYGMAAVCFPEPPYATTRATVVCMFGIVLKRPNGQHKSTMIPGIIYCIILYNKLYDKSFF